jgi:hypothetical protein
VAACLGEGPGRAPYPPSPVILDVVFEPASEVERRAIGSDNWPVTWGDDDALYTSWGDGWGFEPRTRRKLSLGVARITGGPESFSGVNLRSPSVERRGDGPEGPKASGMLMVDGVLYMLVRNTGNCRLVWSEDRGATWTWGFRFETSFGVPSFLNFGRGYEGARDDHVYVYSSDGPSAYESYGRVILARVHRARVRDRAAYEFLETLDEAGRPVWTADIDRRGGIFHDPGRCHRIEVVYHPGLRRYLMALAANGRAGWGLYDAPEPWGPWTTAFHTPCWDTKGTSGYRIPTKWISEDGRTLYVVYSGSNKGDRVNDAFCVRRATLRLAGD